MSTDVGLRFSISCTFGVNSSGLYTFYIRRF